MPTAPRLTEGNGNPIISDNESIDYLAGAKILIIEAAKDTTTSAQIVLNLMSAAHAHALVDIAQSLRRLTQGDRDQDDLIYNLRTAIAELEHDLKAAKIDIAHLENQLEGTR